MTDYATDLRSLNQRLRDLEVLLDNLNFPIATISETYSEPDRPRNGQFAFADGTAWDPGSGRGIYIYNGNTSAWVQWLSLP